MGFGYAIDYDQSIADAQARIDYYARPVLDVLAPVAATLPTYHHNVIDILVVAPHLASALGLSADDLRAIYKVCDLPVEMYTAAGLTAPTPGDYRRGEAICKALNMEHTPDPERLKEERRKARADLARYKRNKAKFGK
jgi:ABC-type transporter Mla subunit MlaD